MKILLSFFILLFTFPAFSHCGVCGEGEAKDHQEKGEDDSHHESGSETSAEAAESEESDDDDGE